MKSLDNILGLALIVSVLSTTAVYSQVEIPQVAGCPTSVFCENDGPVSLGSPSGASGYVLSVQGKIILTGAKLLQKDRWPDYVFLPDYKLLTLPELNEFVRLHKHLPGVPSGTTVKKDGIDVGAMSKVLLEKTEELTLYLLQLDERLKRLEQREREE